MVRKKTWIRAGMQRAGNFENRPEQMLCSNMLREIFPPIYAVFTEYRVHELKEVDEIIPKIAVLDIAVIPRGKFGRKVAVRIMGKIHEGRKQQLKDEDQKALLEGNGWLVFDFWYDHIPELWTPKNYTHEQIKRSVKRELMKDSITTTI